MKFKLAVFRLNQLVDSHRIFTGFLISSFALFLFDVVFYQFFGDGISKIPPSVLGGGFAPEVWLAVLSLVLGTLIIVISIASQGTPRLIDLYLNNWPSIFFVWFIVLSSVHSILFMFIGGLQERFSSEFLNSYVLLPVALMGAVPYIFFILNYSKVDNVIEIIFRKLKNRISYVIRLSYLGVLDNRDVTIAMQKSILEMVNQLMALFYFVGYKESKQEVLNYLTQILSYFIERKSEIKANFFFLSEDIRQDIAFSNHIEYQFQKMEKRRSFVEEKILKEIGLIYKSFLDMSAYDLASSCCAQVVKLGGKAISNENEILTGLITVRINTMFRFSLNHGIRNNSNRIVNNFVFQVGKLMDVIIKERKEKELQRMYGFIFLYGKELYALGLKNKKMSFSFISLIAESRRSLIRLNEEGYEEGFQHNILESVLEINSLQYSNEDIQKRERINNDDFRKVLLGLALYYAGEKKFNMVMVIVEKMINDLHEMPEENKIAIFDRCLESLKDLPMTFWEDNDRGSFNIYYVSEMDLIDPMRQLIHKVVTRGHEEL